MMEECCGVNYSREKLCSFEKKHSEAGASPRFLIYFMKEITLLNDKFCRQDESCQREQRTPSSRIVPKSQMKAAEGGVPGKISAVAMTMMDASVLISLYFIYFVIITGLIILLKKIRKPVFSIVGKSYPLLASLAIFYLDTAL